MKHLLILAAVLMIRSQVLIGQVQSNAEQKPYIEVTGHAEKKVVPDEIYLSITIKEREVGKDKVTVEQQETDLKKALQTLGIGLDRLAVADAQADYIKVKWAKKEVVSQSEYELKLGTAQQVADVFAKLDELDIDNAYISKVNHSNIKALKKEIEVEAIKAAKTKADYLLAAIGQECGTALIINEQASYIANGYMDSMQVRTSSAYGLNAEQVGQSKALGTIEFKKINLETTIYVKFEIK